MKLGYARVSSKDQNLDRQLATLAAEGIEDKHIYKEKLSGKDTNRPELKKLLSYAREGDHIYVHSVDRLGRSLTDLIGIVESLLERGVAISFISDRLTFDKASSDPFNMAMLQVMGVFAQLHRSIIKKSQAEGIAAKRANGTWKGRGAGKKVGEVREDVKIYLAGGASISKTAEKFGIAKSTVQRIKKELTK